MRKFKDLTLASAASLSILCMPINALGQPSDPAPAAEAPKSDEASGPWWTNALVYEIYPRSFQDSDGNGIGDLRGIEKRLDYIQDLGADTIWIAPFYPSPQVDFGYDISNFTEVDPQYGTLADFDRLVEAANKRGIRIVVDIILNHTSDKSEWFMESAASRDNPKADWYIWHDGIDASDPNLSQVQKDNIRRGPAGDVAPPNNWVSAFGGSTWAWSSSRQQFYYHKFYAEQPDLNWRNREVVREMKDVMRFWLDRGVAGFRLDAIEAMFEDETLADDPLADQIIAAGYSWSLPEVHGAMRQVRAVADSYPGNRVLIGEVNEKTTSALVDWYGGPEGAQLHYPMNYPYGFPSLHMQLGGSKADRLDIQFYRRQLFDAATLLNGKRQFIFFDNHDRVRSIDRFSDGQHPAEIAKAVAALLLTVPAAAQIYYGQEIGMVTTTPTRREDVKDPVGRTYWPENKGRDGQRTPMQWTSGQQAGFSSNPDTWLPIPPSAATTNVEMQKEDPQSLLNWYKTLIALRRDNAAMRDGDITLTDLSNENVLSFVRKSISGTESVVVCINMSDERQHVAWEDVGIGAGLSRPRTIVSTGAVAASEGSQETQLPAFGVWIATID